MLIIFHLPADLSSVHLNAAPCPGRLTPTRSITSSPWLLCSWLGLAKKVANRRSRRWRRGAEGVATESAAPLSTSAFWLQTSKGLRSSFLPWTPWPPEVMASSFCQFRDDSVTLGSVRSGCTSLNSSCIKTFLEHHHSTYFIFARTLKHIQDSCWENPMDRGAQQAMVHSVAESGTRLKRLSTHALKDTLIKLTIRFIFRTVSDISFIRSILFRGLSWQSSG